MTDEQKVTILAAQALPRLLAERDAFEAPLADARAGREIADAALQAATDADDVAAAKTQRQQAIAWRRREAELQAKLDAFAKPIAKAQQARDRVLSDTFKGRALQARHAAQEAVDFAELGGADADVRARLAARLAEAEQGVTFAEQLHARQQAERERVAAQAAFEGLA